MENEGKSERILVESWVSDTTDDKGNIHRAIESKTLSELSVAYGIPYITLNHRYKRGLRGAELVQKDAVRPKTYKAPKKQRLTEADIRVDDEGWAKPVKKRGKEATYGIFTPNGFKSLGELSKIHGINYFTLLHRYLNNLRGDDLIKPTKYFKQNY